MRISTNSTALYIQRILGQSQTALEKSLEKLSSGLRINRAADDTAGLILSEKFKMQLAGLTAASSNAQDGISLIQTADGALSEMQRILERLQSLATRSATGTIADAPDRAAMQAETDALLEELHHIASSVSFGEKKLLDGSLSSASIQQNPGTMTNPGTNICFQVDLSGLLASGILGGILGKPLQIGSSIQVNGIIGITGTLLGAAGEVKKTIGQGSLTTIDGIEYMVTTSDGIHLEFTSTTKLNYSVSEHLEQIKKAIVNNGSSFLSKNPVVISNGSETSYSSGNTQIHFTAQPLAGDFIIIAGKKFEFTQSGQSPTDTAAVSVSIGTTLEDTINQLYRAVTQHISDGSLSASVQGHKLTLTNTDTSNTQPAPAVSSQLGGILLQIGKSSQYYDTMKISISDMRPEALGIARLDIQSQTSAKEALERIAQASKKISVQRGQLGAWENRLGHSVQALEIEAETITAANNHIRNTDMAKEFSHYTQLLLLQKSAYAMLAQANQIPQQVLKLLP